MPPIIAPITDPQSIPFGLLVTYAEDMYTPGALAPKPDARIAALDWTVVNYLTGYDALFPAPENPDKTLKTDLTQRVFFGFVARNTADPTSYAVVIRGTAGIIEWVIDAQFLLVAHPDHPAARVEHGFWDIYHTFSLADLSGATTSPNAADGIAALIGGSASVVVVGHSLGSALGTYLAADLAARLPGRVSACLFASPRTGDAAWTNVFTAAVTNYRLFNYIIDIVPHVPGLGFVTLPNATVIQPDAAQAGICLDILCDHHVLCYCAMIDCAATPAADWSEALGIDNRVCILGGAATMPEAAKALAVLINAFGIDDDKAVALLKALHPRAQIKLAAVTPATTVVAAAAAQPPTAPFNPAVPR